MNIHLHWLTRRRIHQLFTHELKPSRHRALFHTLSACEACAGQYDRHHRLEATLCRPGQGGGPSVFAVERIRNVIFDTAPAAVGHPCGETFPKPVKWIAGVILATCAAALLIFPYPGSKTRERVVINAGDPISDVQVVARGSTPHAAEIGIRLFRVDAAGATRHAERSNVGEVDALVINDVITLTYTNLRPDIRYATIFGIQGDGGIRWYYPSYSAKVSIPIRSDRVDEPLEDGIRLQVHHTPGWLRITAVFSAEPMTVNAVVDVVRRRQSQGPDAMRDLGALEFSGQATLQHSLLTQILPVP
jgi:hypothetical protein